MKSLARLAVVATLWAFADPVRAADLPPEHLKFFESKVRPLLVEYCSKCHGPDEQKSDLRVDSRGALLTGGEAGPAIVPGDPDGSLLIQAVRYDGYEMPPSGKLRDEQIAVLVKWIEIGAPWPGGDDAPVVIAPKDKFTDEDRQWWAFQPVKNPPVPRTANDAWSRTDLDRFVYARLVQEGLTPAAEADRTALIRRVYFDLIGLPPTPEEVDAFVTDSDPLAYEKMVDRLLASPQYGERWARHWLDLVRYADSDGYRIDHYRSEAWRYRDYVVKSFNDDKPYDRFVQEQLAGDELFPNDPDALIATGYLRHGIYEYNNRDAHAQWDLMLNEITDCTGDVFLGMGMQCARCHDHKFDPILQRDYFRLRAFFEPLAMRDRRIAFAPEQQAEYETKLAAWERETAALREELETLEAKYREKAAQSAIEKFPEETQKIMRKPASERTPYEQQIHELAYRQVDYEYSRLESMMKGEDKERYLALRRDLAKFDAKRPAAPPTIQAACDVGATAPPTVIPKKKTVVEPGYLTILDDQDAAIAGVEVPNTTGRRATLARWLTRPDNQLSTRVIVNRVWQFHFGRGLTPNSSDFGRLGEPPSHPELLDWLTTRFVADGWKLKSLHRLILTSAVYRQATTHPQFASQNVKDPANRWYWRADTRRLDAEQIRDAILAATGELDAKAGGPGVPGDQPRRSIYTRVMRNARDPLLDVFDLPQFFSSQASRDTTTTPIQSLLLINSQTMLRYAGGLAGRAKKEFQAKSAEGTASAIRRVWRLAWGREPNDRELAAAMKFLDEQTARLEKSGGGKEVEVREQVVDAANVQTTKMPFRDGQSIVFLPDEKQQRFVIPHDEKMSAADFTVEAYFQVRSVYDSGSVRTIASKWNGDRNQPGWSFGVTGKGSRRKPQTLVMQLFAPTADGAIKEAALFSDQHIELNKPYYVAASVFAAQPDAPGKVIFYLKDLSNDDEPLLTAVVEHPLPGGFTNREPLSIGRLSGSKTSLFDGLIDDVRLSKAALKPGELLFTSEGIGPTTMGYWRFEPDPGVFRDASPNAFHIDAAKKSAQSIDARWTAFVDLCHVLLNSNPFLYVH